MLRIHVSLEIILVAVLQLTLSANAFLPPYPPAKLFSSAAGTSIASSLASSQTEFTVIKQDQSTDEWELDCYSRPVVVGGKKLWEVLITDSAGSFRFCQQLPSNQVNSKTLRKVVDDLIEEVDVKPTIIRFFRGAMFNMISIALSDLSVTSKPSRCTFALA